MAFLVLAVILASSIPGCSPRRDPWASATDRRLDWLPRVVAAGGSALVAWQDATSGTRTAVERRGPDLGEPVAAATGSHLALDLDGKIGAFSSTGVIAGALPAGVMTTDLRTGEMRRLTLAPTLDEGVPGDRPWPTLFFDRSGNPLWLGQGPTDAAGRFDYPITRLDNVRGLVVLDRFVDVSYVALSPDRSTLGIAGTKTRGAKNSMFLLDLATGKTTEQLNGRGVGWLAFTAEGNGYAVVGKVPRSADDVTADEVINRALFSGGAIVEWSVGTEPRAISVDFGDQYPEQVSASPDGRWLSMVAWHKSKGGARSSHVWLLDRLGGTAKDLTPQARIAGEPRFSPGSKSLAFGTDANVVRYDLGSSNERQLLGDGAQAVWGAGSSYAWPDDDHLLLFAIPPEGRLSLWESGPAGNATIVATRPHQWK